MNKRKISFIMIVVFAAISFSVYSISMTGNSTPVADADQLDDASDLCLMLHTDLNTNSVDWTAFYKCVGNIISNSNFDFF